MVLGNKLSLEFRSYAHGKNNGGRGGKRGGGPINPPMTSEDYVNRWGFRLVIRPIFGEPAYYLNQNLKKDLINTTQNSTGGDEAISSLVSVMNQLFFTASKFSRAVTNADISASSSN